MPRDFDVMLNLDGVARDLDLLDALFGTARDLQSEGAMTASRSRPFNRGSAPLGSRRGFAGNAGLG
jgi:hypothetical protein